MLRWSGRTRQVIDFSRLKHAPTLAELSRSIIFLSHAINKLYRLEEVLYKFECWLQYNGFLAVFENKIVGGSIPKEYINPIEKGVKEAAEGGVLAGYPVVDIKVTLFDGSFHEVDSSEMAFKMAAILGFKEGVQKGHPILLEPMMKVEVVVPEEYLGDVMGQINSRRGLIQGMEVRLGNAQAVKAMVPLAEMFGYATQLRSATQGRGVFNMEFDHYAPVSQSVAEEILKA